MELHVYFQRVVQLNMSECVVGLESFLTRERKAKDMAERWERKRPTESDIIARVEAAGNKIMTKCDGDIYYGQMEGDNKEGCGTYTWASGSNYVGEWKYGKKDGYGIYTYANGCKYVGQYKNDTIHGYGTYTYANGTVYEGEYKDGKANGQGTQTHANGTIVHSGEWENANPIKLRGCKIETNWFVK